MWCTGASEIWELRSAIFQIFSFFLWTFSRFSDFQGNFVLSTPLCLKVTFVGIRVYLTIIYVFFCYVHWCWHFGKLHLHVTKCFEIFYEMSRSYAENRRNLHVTKTSRNVMKYVTKYYVLMQKITTISTWWKHHEMLWNVLRNITFFSRMCAYNLL